MKKIVEKHRQALVHILTKTILNYENFNNLPQFETQLLFFMPTGKKDRSLNFQINHKTCLIPRSRFSNTGWSSPAHLRFHRRVGALWGICLLTSFILTSFRIRMFTLAAPRLRWWRIRNKTRQDSNIITMAKWLIVLEASKLHGTSTYRLKSPTQAAV